jgi:hypothetical protein
LFGFVPPPENNISGVIVGDRTDENSFSISDFIVATERVATDRGLKQAGNMALSVADVPLSPVERPRCARCRARMNLTSVTPCDDHSEKRLFECPKCNSIDTGLAIDPLRSEEINRLTDNVRPPA